MNEQAKEQMNKQLGKPPTNGICTSAFLGT